MRSFLASWAPVLVLALVWASDGKAEEKKDPKGGKNGQEAPEEEPALESEAKALDIFGKAVAWQGKPAGAGKLIDLQVDKMNFKLWGENEVEGHFEFWYTAPDKVRFKVWTKAWWRSYWTNGDAHYKKTAATKTGCEYLNPKVKEDTEAIEIVNEALRIARLIVLGNHRSDDVVFQYWGLHNPKGKKDTPKCHLVKRFPKKGDPGKELMYFFLSQKDFSPVCISVIEFLNFPGIFFIHLSRYVPFEGIRIPTRIEIYHEKGPGEFRRFLFADVVHKPEESIKVRVNHGIDDELYEFQKK